MKSFYERIQKYYKDEGMLTPTRKIQLRAVNKFIKHVNRLSQEGVGKIALIKMWKMLGDDVRRNRKNSVMFKLLSDINTECETFKTPKKLKDSFYFFQPAALMPPSKPFSKSLDEKIDAIAEKKIQDGKKTPFSFTVNYKNKLHRVRIY